MCNNTTQQEQYAEIVRRFADPTGEFFRRFRNTMKKYRPTLTEDGIQDLYQDSFIAAQKNLMEGRIRENTSWNSYLISIGLNLATHEFRHFGETIDDTHIGDGPDEDVAVYNTPEVQRVFGEVLEFMNEKCRQILKWTLGWDNPDKRLSSEEIAAAFDSTPRSIITQRNRCKNRLVELVRAKLISLGYEIKGGQDNE